jgi:thymidylate kinase
VRRHGRLVAIDSRSWHVHQREIGAAYRTELARELQALGFEIHRSTGRGGRYFELTAIPQGLLDRWSSRHHQVQAVIRQRLTTREQQLQETIAQGGPDAIQAEVALEQLRESGQLSPKEDRLMGAVTRTAKIPVTTQDLDQEWRRTALQHQISRERIEVLRHLPKHPLTPASPQEVLVALTEFDSTFAARQARAAALEQSAGTPIEEALHQLQALRAGGEILLLADGTGTTKDHRGYEHAVIAITQRLATTHVQVIPEETALRETDRLDQELAKIGGRLSDEQRAAIRLACGEQPLVVIQGHAGSGKNTTLTGIARAHQHTGREIIVTSTAALAAERLANELAENGVDCTAFSTAGLHAAINHGRVQLGPDTTVIHDEAALASTREQLRLLHAVETSGARLIAVGDPQQNQPVGAGGLWDHIEHTAMDAGVLVQLTQNQRAQDPADRHAQALFRKGEIEYAIRTYNTRDRIHTSDNQQSVEDQALEAAQQDREDGRRTLVIAQTSNEHLDELNARAQAIRQQHRELGDTGLDIPGRPYQLYQGDDVQIRHTINHPEHGALQNGTSAAVTSVDPRTGELTLRLGNGQELVLDEQQIERADLRLAYVQHPFPAQGHTTDTAHVIIAGQVTREGTYVAITRAREQTDIYDATPENMSPEADRLAQLADRVSRTEPEIPSISTPLAHETRTPETTDTAQRPITGPSLEAALADQGEVEPEAFRRQASTYRLPTDPSIGHIRTSDLDAVSPTQTVLGPPHRAADWSNDQQRPSNERDESPGRIWPVRPEDAESNTAQPDDGIERDESPRWEM